MAFDFILNGVFLKLPNLSQQFRDSKQKKTRTRQKKNRGINVHLPKKTPPLFVGIFYSFAVWGGGPKYCWWGKKTARLQTFGPEEVSKHVS